MSVPRGYDRDVANERAFIEQTVLTDPLVADPQRSPLLTLALLPMAASLAITYHPVDVCPICRTCSA